MNNLTCNPMLTICCDVDIQHHEGTFGSSSGLSLYYQSWLPKSEIRAVIGIVHGLGGHSGMFGTLVERLAPSGYGLYGLDLRGHGRSPGQRGYIDSWLDFRTDVQRFLNVIVQRHPETPIFLWGHSLGGLIVLDAVMQDDTTSSWLNGIVVTAPALGPVGVSPIRMGIGKWLSRLWPRFSLDTGLSSIPPSRDPAIAQAILTDPLCHRRGTARLATEFSKTAQWVQAHPHRVQLPILIVHGGHDLVTQPQSSQTFFETLQYLDKERKEYEDSYHEIHMDINYREVLADAQHWLDLHLEPSSDRTSKY